MANTLKMLPAMSDLFLVHCLARRTQSMRYPRIWSLAIGTHEQIKQARSNNDNLRYTPIGIKAER
jgi:hypothetical protein